LLRKVEDILGEIEVIALDVPADTDYGRIRSELELAGQPIGSNDLLIAAHARGMKVTLVTANVREFSRISGLKIENWVDEQRKETDP
jgi:tRNA(fMet)-specific endonuclease VapC